MRNGLSRRSLLALPMVSAVLPTLNAAAQTRASGLNGEPSLRELGKQSGIPYGLVEPTYSFPANRGYYEQLCKEANLYVPGNEFSWATVEKAKGARAYGKLDTIVNFMKERDMGIVGHTLLWYYAAPKWLAEMSAAEVGDAMTSYVSETVQRYRGSVVRWDVINEQVSVKNDVDGLRHSFYLDRLGPDYMKRAFAAARAADPKVLLCYNDYGFEYKKPDQVATRQALLKLLRKFRDDKVEVDCLGLQSHLDTGLQLDLDGLSVFMREVKSLGYKIAITELDVIDENLVGDEDTRDSVVANHVKDYLTCVTADMKPVTITSWGFTDGHTWLTMWHRRKDGRAMRPLPFDDQYNRKAQWSVIAQFLR